MSWKVSTNLWRVWIAALILYWCALVAGTHWPKIPAIGPHNFDKVLHFTAYGGLMTLLSIAIIWGKPAPWRVYLTIFIGLAIFGGLDELTQPPFGRTADWFDWFADVSGLIFGLFVAIAVKWIIARWIHPRQQPPE